MYGKKPDQIENEMGRTNLSELTEQLTEMDEQSVMKSDRKSDRNLTDLLTDKSDIQEAVRKIEQVLDGIREMNYDDMTDVLLVICQSGLLEQYKELKRMSKFLGLMEND